MRVRELIAALEKLPPDLPVYFSCIDSFFDCEISSIEQAKETINIPLAEDDPRRHGMQPLLFEEKEIEVVNLAG